MGNAVSSNTVEDLVNISTSIVNKYNQDCSVSTNNEQKIVLAGCKNVTITGLNNNQYTLVNVKCLQEANTQVQINSEVAQSMKQAAEAIVQNFGLPANVNADNLIRATVELGTEVVNSYTSICSASFRQNQEIQCTDSSNIVISGVNNNQTAIQFADCVLNTTTNSAAANQVRQIIDQSAVAREESIFSGFVIFLFLAAIIFVIIIFR